MSIIEGILYGRNGFIGEYIRRRTGVVRDLHQVLYRLDAVIRAATGDLTEVAKLRAATVPREELRLRKWKNFLGSDLFPPAKPKRSSAKDIDETDDETPRLKTKKRKTQSASMKSSDSNPFQPRLSVATSDSLGGSRTTSFGSGLQFAPTFTTPQPILNAFPPSPSSSSSSVPIVTSILITVAPSRDPSALVAALLNSGLSTISDAIDLLFMDDSTIRFFFEELGKRNGLGLLDLAWAAKAFEAARKEVAGM
ncbi:TEA/ATTS family protein, transcription factor AbaA [Rhodotorula toruloides]|uniref:TEA/ATTS family protein, transcription factor AbaA n=1 Tax=Rhodotorula toruloides TaxID=5286 RepID=A0A511KP79_RHOTO|nr:TEA/ATTS family protein, transcription factor AbaA [Rhodotorula toruloides]